MQFKRQFKITSQNKGNLPIILFLDQRYGLCLFPFKVWVNDLNLGECLIIVCINSEFHEYNKRNQDSDAAKKDGSK